MELCLICYKAYLVLSFIFSDSFLCDPETSALVLLQNNHSGGYDKGFFQSQIVKKRISGTVKEVHVPSPIQLKEEYDKSTYHTGIVTFCHKQSELASMTC